MSKRTSCKELKSSGTKTNSESRLVNYSWGDVWDERQRKEDEKRLYGSGRYPARPDPPNLPRRNHYSTPRGGNGKKAAIVLGVVIAAIAGLLVINPLHLQLPILSLPQQSVEDTSSTEIQMTGLDTTDEDEDIGVLQQPETISVTNTLVQIQLNFIGEQMEQVDVEIPANNNGVLHSVITPDTNTSVTVEITKNELPYCSGSVCSFEMAAQGAVGSGTVEYLDIPVSEGDKLNFLIYSHPRGFTQVVDVTLTTMYEKSEVSSEPAVPEEPVIAPVAEEPETSDYNVAYIERRVHELINEYRVQNGMPVLEYDAELVLIARNHSEDMAENDYFEHDNLKGMDPSERAEAAGYSCFKNYGEYYTNGLAENIWQGWLYDSITYINGVPFYNWLSNDEIAQQAADGWIDSPGHRSNILGANYDKEGVGVGISSDSKVYITEDFC